MTASSFRRYFLILIVVLVTLAFLWMVQAFLMTVLLAALFTGVAYPVYDRFVKWFGGRQTLAAITTLLLLVAVIILPLLAIAGAVASEAARVNDTLLPNLQKALAEPGTFDRLLQH